MTRRHHYVLIPGFFGFASIGELRYFAHVQQFLEDELSQRGVPHTVRAIATRPTASLPRRAAVLAEAIAEIEASTGPIHLVGHSTGGLDARLLASPGVSLPTEVDVERSARRVRSVVAVAAPHFGTPMATFFSNIMGQQILRALSAATIQVVRMQRVPGRALGRLARVIGEATADRLSGGLVDQIYRDILADFSEERRGLIAAFLGEVRGDAGLLPQLTPDGMDLFNAKVRRRKQVRYGSVVVWARPPNTTDQAILGLNASAQATYSLFRMLYRLAGAPSRIPGPDTWSSAQREVLVSAGLNPSLPRANDAVVPTRSQVFGDIVHAVRADHLDVIGHFNAPHRAPPHVDWLRTLSEFDREGFEALWRDVTTFTLDE